MPWLTESEPVELLLLLNLESSISICFFLAIYLICHVQYHCASESHPPLHSLLCLISHCTHLPPKLVVALTNTQSNHRRRYDAVLFFSPRKGIHVRAVCKKYQYHNPCSLLFPTSSISLSTHPLLTHILRLVLSCLKSVFIPFFVGLCSVSGVCPAGGAGSNLESVPLFRRWVWVPGCVRVCLRNSEKYLVVDVLILRQDNPPLQPLHDPRRIPTNTNHTHIISTDYYVSCFSCYSPLPPPPTPFAQFLRSCLPSCIRWFDSYFWGRWTEFVL
ncbi:hypothetical protein EV426DRAFT_213720 [Tirmania nivea]|nr:hypothetical protein EV426DRAFT_213720 [Tirmania nivea]